MATPDYVLMELIEYGDGRDRRQIHPGTFVRPIEECYVPIHVLKQPKRPYSRELDVFCYTPRDGIIPIAKRLIRRV